MKLISNEEAAGIFKALNNRNHPVRNMLLQLQPGHNLQIEKKDWNWKTRPPSAICRDLEKTTKLRFDCFAMLDKSGWIITRTI